MIRQIAFIAALLLNITGIEAQDGPFGWATSSTSATVGDYQLDGGGDGSVTVLKSDGTDMSEAIKSALRDYDIVVFDGSEGDFILSERVNMGGLHGRTLIGINGARLRTEFYVTPEIRVLLDDLNVGAMSSNSADGGGGTLPNGSIVAEEREYNIRKALIEYYGNDREHYRKAGIFEINGCTDLIIRNIEFVGPGSLDVGGSDLLTLMGSRNIWIDHCHFTDGLDGNMDIITGSSQITVSWCVFDYTDLAYNHSLSNLISGQTGIDEENLNITWAYCRWGQGCQARLPWTHFGINHILNCHYNCPGASCIQGSDNARFLVEGCYFDRSVRKPYSDTGTAAITWRNNIMEGRQIPADKGYVEMGYTYEVYKAADVPSMLSEKAGATLTSPFTRDLSCYPCAIDLKEIYCGIEVPVDVNICHFPVQGSDVNSEACTISASSGITMTIDGLNYTDNITLTSTDHYIVGNIKVKIKADQAGEFSGHISLKSGESTCVLPITAEVRDLGHFISDVNVSWPFNKGDNNPRVCESTVADAFRRSTYAIGANLYTKGTITPNGGKPMTRLNPVISIPKYRHADSYLQFSVIPDADVTFIPETLTFKASRVATDMSAIDVEIVSDDGRYTVIRGAQPERNSNTDIGFTVYNIGLSEIRLSQKFDIVIYIYNLTDNKQVAISDVELYGRLFASDAGTVSISTDINEEQDFYDLKGIRIPHPVPGQIYITKGNKYLKAPHI